MCTQLHSGEKRWWEGGRFRKIYHLSDLKWENNLLVKSSRSSASASAANSSGVFFFRIRGFGSSCGGASTISSFFFMLYCEREMKKQFRKLNFYLLRLLESHEGDMLSVLSTSIALNFDFSWIFIFLKKSSDQIFQLIPLRISSIWVSLFFLFLPRCTLFNVKKVPTSTQNVNEIHSKCTFALRICTVSNMKGSAELLTRNHCRRHHQYEE